jgi:hypothetical protein
MIKFLDELAAPEVTLPETPEALASWVEGWGDMLMDLGRLSDRRARLAAGREFIAMAGLIRAEWTTPKDVAADIPSATGGESSPPPSEPAAESSAAEVVPAVESVDREEPLTDFRGGPTTGRHRRHNG